MSVRGRPEYLNFGILSPGCKKSEEKSYCGTKKTVWFVDNSRGLISGSNWGERFEETLTDLDRYEVKLSLNWGC